MVFVLDRHQRPLMPCSEKRARQLLQRGRAVVHRRVPFVIRLKDRTLEASARQPVVLKLDPGAQTTGMALVHAAPTSDGPIHQALHLAELTHRGERIRDLLGKRANYRRRRRSANLRYRAPRCLNRRRRSGWLPPSLRSRVANCVAWGRRYQHWTPITQIALEVVRFDTQALQDPEIAGVEYQRGDLFGWEVWQYLLAKWGHRCAYCEARDVPLEQEHILPRSRGGSNRISNLTIACHPCNQRKGAQTAEEFGYPAVQAQARASLRDAAAVNSTRWTIRAALAELGLPIAGWSGGRTKWNRVRFGLAKTHALDALCVGDIAGVRKTRLPVLALRAMGRGLHQRALVNKHGIARGHRSRSKQAFGVQTGDLVRAVVLTGKQAGVHVGRVVIRASGSFRVGAADGIPQRTCRVLQRADGYEYGSVPSQP